MPARYSHLLTQDGLETHLVSNGHIEEIGHFAANAHGHVAFAQWLAQTSEGLHTIVVDVPDEGFAFDTVPYVFGPDRRALITRKLTQQFFGATFSTALSLGRQSEGRRDERLLFVAITRSEIIEPWLAVLRAASCAVSAVVSVPLLTHELVRHLCPNEKNGLIVLLSPSGIRHIYFEQGQLRFSRLSPAPEGTYSGWGAACVSETHKTVQYLTAQRWLARGSALRIHVVVSSQEAAPLFADIEQINTAPDTLQFVSAPIEALAARLDPTLVQGSSDARALILRLTQRSPLRTQLAPAAERHFYRIWQTRFAILSLAGLTLFASLVLATRWSIQAHLETLQAESRESAALMENLRYRKLVAELPQLPTSLDSLRDTVDQIARIQASVRDPRDLLVILSHTLDRFPEITLDKIEWSDGAPASLIDTAQGAAHPRLLVSCSLDPALASDPRATLARIQSFADILRAQSKGSVTMQQLPFEVDSGKTLRSDAQAVNARPAFRLELIAGDAS